MSRSHNLYVAVASGIQNLLTKPCESCVEAKPHSPFYCANFYENVKFGSEDFVIPEEISPGILEWLKAATTSQKWLTICEGARFLIRYKEVSDREVPELDEIIEMFNAAREIDGGEKLKF